MADGRWDGQDEEFECSASGGDEVVAKAVKRENRDLKRSAGKNKTEEHKKEKA